MKKAVFLVTLLKRFKISFFAIMFVSLCVSSVFATEHDAIKYNSDQNTQNGLSPENDLSRNPLLQNGDTINVKNDITITANESDVEYKSLTNMKINGNGYTVSGDASNIGDVIEMDNSSFEVNNLNFDSLLPTDDIFYIHNGSTVTINSGKISNSYSEQMFYIVDSKVDVNNYIIEKSSSSNSRLFYNDYSELNINNSNIASEDGSCIESNLYSTITINNSNIYSENAAAVYVKYSSTLTVNKSDIEGYYGIHSNYSNIDLKDTNISSKDGNALYVYVSTATITGCDISALNTGLGLEYSTATVDNSKIYSTDEVAIGVSYSSTTVTGSDIHSENSYGLDVFSSKDVYIENSKISSKNSDAIRLDNSSTVELTDTDVLSEGGIAIDVEKGSNLWIFAKNKNVLIDSPIGNNGISATNDSRIYLEPEAGKKITVTNGINSDSIVDIGYNSGNGTVELGGSNNMNNVRVYDTKIKLLKGATFSATGTAEFFNSSEFDAANGEINNNNNNSDISFGTLSSVSGTLKFDLDVDLNKEESDFLSMVYLGRTSPIVVKKLNLMSDTSKDKVSVPFTNLNLDPHISLDASQQKLLGPVYAYDVEISSYDVNAPAVNPTVAPSATAGNYFTFSRATGKGSINPNVLTGKVAVAGVSVSQEEIFDTVFNNAGNFSFFTKQTLPISKADKDKEVTPPSYREAPTIWVKAFGSQEDVDLEDYTKLKTNYFGAIVGIDWDRKYWDGLDATYGIFASYIGGELKDDEFSSNKVNQNGGYLGVRGNWYLGKLFINGIVDFGYIQNGADTSEDSNNFNSSVIGLAARVGYNFELYDRSFTLQPSLGLTGKYVITDDFEFLSSSQKLKQKFDNLTNVTIEPGVKLAKNLGRCWILSGEGKYVIENTNGDIRIEYNNNNFDIVLPDMDYKNYASAGLGIEKIWGYTVLNVKANKTFGGRDGFVVNAGLEYKF